MTYAAIAAITTGLVLPHSLNADIIFPNRDWNEGYSSTPPVIKISATKNEYVNKVKSTIESSNWVEEYNKSIYLVWKNEVIHFMNYYGLNTSKEFYDKVVKLQSDWGLDKIDWKVWSDTLKNIYINVYSDNLNLVSEDVKLRWKEYNEMLNYKPRVKNWETIYPSISNEALANKVFNKSYYYGRLWTTNIDWTFIDSSLEFKVPKTIKDNWISAFIEKIDWKFVAILYINWRLELASYTSPWLKNPSGKSIETPEWTFTSTWSDKYFISSTEVSKWAVMPDAVNVHSWIYCHAWNVDWYKRSHWCIRLPKKYSKWMYIAFNKHWDITWHISWTEI